MHPHVLRRGLVALVLVDFQGMAEYAKQSSSGK